LLNKVPGIHFQKVRSGNVTTVKDFSVVIDENEFGMNRDLLVECLTKENIHSKKYFYPPIHCTDAYQEFREKYHDTLPVTGKISKNIICLPIYSNMGEETVRKICQAIKKIQFYHNEIKKGSK